MGVHKQSLGFSRHWCWAHAFRQLALLIRMPEKGRKKPSDEEQRLALQSFEEDKEPSEIADLLKRDKSTLTRFLCKKVPRRK